MNWITNLVRPKIRALVNKDAAKKDVPDNLWARCPSCGAMLHHQELAKNLQVCTQCNYHFRLGAEARLNLMFDDAQWEMVNYPKVVVDPLRFKDSKRYADRLRDAQSKTGLQDAIIIGAGKIGGQPAVVAAFEFAFMGGSMGMGVGEAILAAATQAVARQAAFITVPSSGGARMQEGILSLMQMPRTTIAVEQVKEAGLPYIVVLTDPTTGGVSASFAMLGDIQIAEPGAVIGFAGARVIEETIRARLPEGFQRADYLREHGMVDIVIPRKDMKEQLGRILNIIMAPPKSAEIVGFVRR